MTTMTTDMLTCYPLGRARDVSMLSGGVQAHAVGQATVTNPWLGGFGFGDGMGICSTTVVEDSAKRIHPGRLEGMT